MDNHRSLVILGAGPTMEEGLEIARREKCECWGCNYMVNPEITMLFQMHGDSFIKARFLDFYRENPPKVPIVMHHEWDELPTSVAFPVMEHTEHIGFGRMLIDSKHDGIRQSPPYHACTMGYMVSLALLMGYKRLYVYGVDFYSELRHESTYERPSVEFYLGWAIANGATIQIPENSRLLTTGDNLRQIYGIEWNPRLTTGEVAALSQMQ